MIDERRESLVEMTATEQIVNICRVVKDELNELHGMLRNYGNIESSEISKLYSRIREMKNKGEALVVLTLEYLVRGSEIALYASNYINMIRLLDRVIQEIDAVAYRLYLAHENKIMLNKDVLDTFIKLIELEKAEIEGVEKALSRIRLSPKNVLEAINEVFTIEEEIDSIYRKSLFEIYSSYSGYITALLIFKDIFEHLEDISDVIKGVGEEIRYLALARTPV